MPEDARTALRVALSAQPIIAILRGLTPDHALGVGEALIESGIRVIEVPLNSPNAFESIERLAKRFGGQAVIGAGTVVRADDVERVVGAGARVVLAPNLDADVVVKCLALGVEPAPGVATPTEAFRAIALGAQYLKLFPAAALGVGFVRAIREVLPGDAKLIAVGGVGEGNALEWMKSSADGVGVGGSLYRPGDAPEIVGKRARQLVAALAPAATA